MSDLIKREDVLKIINETLPFEYEEDRVWAETLMNNIPSVEPIEWIPCSERLPEKHGEYLVTATYIDKPYVTTDEYFSYGWDDWDEVIAWAERPKPWKGARANGRKSSSV